MGLYRHINYGWNYSGFAQFAGLVNEHSGNDLDLYEFVEFSGNEIPWQLCKKAAPKLLKLSALSIFQETGHQETMIKLAEAMAIAAVSKKPLLISV